MRDLELIIDYSLSVSLISAPQLPSVMLRPVYRKNGVINSSRQKTKKKGQKPR